MLEESRKSEETTGKKPKKRRSRADKGTIRMSHRDRYCVAWIAEQPAVRGDQIQRLLARYPVNVVIKLRIFG